MEQGYKDFLISGTKDKTLMRLLEDDIVNDTGIFMFVANAKETIKKHIEEFKNTISNSNLGTIEAWDKKYSVPDCFKRTLLASTDYVASCNVNATEVYGDFNNMPSAPSVKESPLMVVTQTSSLVEICNFKDLTFSIHAESKFSEFSNFKLMVDVISHIVKETKNDKKNKPNSLIKSKESDNSLVGRYIVERIDCNNFYGMLQVRFVSRYKRVVYNHYFLKDKDYKQSLQLIDEEYKLGVIKSLILVSVETLMSTIFIFIGLIALCSVLIFCGGAYFQNNFWKFATIVVFYFLMNVAYTFKLKHVAIIDVCIIAIGFVLRVLAGGYATGIYISQWAILLTFVLALVLAIGKRRGELINAQISGKTRRALDGYNVQFADIALSISCTLAIVCYLMFTLSPEVQQKFHSRVFYTVIFVVFAFLRYLQQTLVYNKTESPTKIVYRDRYIQVTLVLWLAAFLLQIYFK